MKKARKLLCTSHIGCLTVELWVNPDTMGGLCSTSGTPWISESAGGNCGCIEIGLADDDWESIVSTLLHEAFELYCIAHGHRYDPSPTYSGSADVYLFILTHPQMSECFGSVAPFVATVLPTLASQHRKWSSHV